MFYEEKWIDGILHFRTNPDDEFSPASQQLLSAKLAALRTRVAELEAALGDCAADNHELLGDNERLRRILQEIVDYADSGEVQDGVTVARAALEQSHD